jgi:hypothetical protein
MFFSSSYQGQGSRGMPHMHTVEMERDAGLECLTVIERFYALAADPGRLRHAFFTLGQATGCGRPESPVKQRP